MIVVFKPETLPSRPGPVAAVRSAPDVPIAAVEIGRRYLICCITIIGYNLKAGLRSMIRKSMRSGIGPMGGYRVSERSCSKKTDYDDSFKTAMADRVKARKDSVDGGALEVAALDMGELSELLGYSLKRAQLRIFDDFLALRRAAAAHDLLNFRCCFCSTRILEPLFAAAMPTASSARARAPGRRAAMSFGAR